MGFRRMGTTLQLSVSGPAGERDEFIDLIKILSEELKALGRPHSVIDHVIIDRETRLEFAPQIVSFRPAVDLSMHMSTIIDIRHVGAFPEAIYEYQHSHGPTGVEAVRKGFRQWFEIDLPALLDALRDEPLDCMALSIPKADGQKRRAVLGPVHLRLGIREDGSSAADEPEAEHDRFCPCCFLIQSKDAFQPVIEDPRPQAIRMFAVRHDDGSFEADCRVNGEDFEPGKQALLQFAQSWLGTGLETRKQYVILQDEPPDPTEAWKK